MTTAQPHDEGAGLEGEEAAEADWGWTDDDSAWIPPDIDTDSPSPARMYDYSLGGKDNFEIDRKAVLAVGEIVPEFRAVGLANRGFLVRAVDTMARLGIDQFIDIGTGIPTSPNVHEIAQLVRPDTRVIYVDNDPIVMAHNRALRAPRPGVVALQRDMRQPRSVMEAPEVLAHLDFERPIGLLFIAVLHFVRRELATEVVAQFLKALPAGSYVAISTACSDGMDPILIKRLEEVYSQAPAPMVLRTTEQIEQLCEGIELIEPGLVDVTQWRNDGTPLPIRILSGVGRVLR
jgi:hypothetical protein